MLGQIPVCCSLVPDVIGWSGSLPVLFSDGDFRMHRERGVGQYLVTLGSVSKLSRLAPVPLPAGTRLGNAREFEIAFATFEQIRVAFPEVAMTLDPHHPHAEYMTINLPVSGGLSECGPRTGREIQS